jgi:hypothetical protein
MGSRLVPTSPRRSTSSVAPRPSTGAINIMQRPGAGSVILNAGHKVFDLETGLPLLLKGPDHADHEDLRRDMAP